MKIFLQVRTNYMVHVFGDEWLHPPRTQKEIESVVNESTRRGYPGCVGFMDGVHIQWDMCPTQWRHLSIGKDGTASIGTWFQLCGMRCHFFVSPTVHVRVIAGCHRNKCKHEGNNK